MVPGLSSLIYPERLRELNMPTLANMRIRGDMIQDFKLTSGAYDKDHPTMLENQLLAWREMTRSFLLIKQTKTSENKTSA